MPESQTDRLDAIEIKLAHLEHVLAELNDVVVRQQKEIQLALLRSRELKTQMEVMEAASGSATNSYEKPPHY
jgi:uncharacterized coiled-coil protein SlyX